MHSAVVFAGGKSSRMGRDKALLPFGGYGSMAEFQYRKLQECFGRVYISSKNDKFDFDANVIQDLYPQSSPMIALASVFEQLDDDELFILSVDMPLIGRKEIESLVRHYEDTNPSPDVLIAKSPRGKEPLFGIYSKAVLPISKKLLRNDIHKLGILLESVSTETLQFDDQGKFANINTPEEYSSILR